MEISTPDLCDQFGDQVAVLDPVFHHYGGVQRFGGEVVTVKCFEDNSKVAEMVVSDGRDRVLVVDGGGVLRRALLGDQLVSKAVVHGWAGIIIYGAIRDVEDIQSMAIGVAALGSHPRKTQKRGEGQINVPVCIAGVNVHPGDYVYADATGVIVSGQEIMHNRGKQAGCLER